MEERPDFIALEVAHAASLSFYSNMHVQAAFDAFATPAQSERVRDAFSVRRSFVRVHSYAQAQAHAHMLNAYAQPLSQAQAHAHMPNACAQPLSHARIRMGMRMAARTCSHVVARRREGARSASTTCACRWARSCAVCARAVLCARVSRCDA
eukprot:6190953-Pleurochrysis_carterae.AAC.2